MNHCESDFTFRPSPDSELNGVDENAVTAHSRIVSAVAPGENEPRERPGVDYSGVTLYLREIGQIRRLTRIEELDLVARHKQGDKEARERLITANLRLVVAVARGYEGFGLPLLDLISEGNIGLTRAVDRFDPSRGAGLATYAFVRIRSAVTRSIFNHAKTVRVPVNVFEHWAKLRRAETRLREQFGREPTESELSKHVGSSIARVNLVRRAVLRHVSLDAETGDHSDSKPMCESMADKSVLSPSDELERSCGAAVLKRCLEHLPPAEAETLVRRFGLDGGEELTLEAIGQQMGVTREGVRQIERRALQKLRRLLKHMRT